MPPSSFSIENAFFSQEGPFSKQRGIFWKMKHRASHGFGRWAVLDTLGPSDDEHWAMASISTYMGLETEFKTKAPGSMTALHLVWERKPMFLLSGKLSRTLLIQSTGFPQPFQSLTCHKKENLIKSPAGMVLQPGPGLGSSRRRELPASHTNKLGWRCLPA